MRDNSFGLGHFPLPVRLSGLGDFMDALRPKNLLHYKVWTRDGVWMLTVRAARVSVMRRDLESLLRVGLIKIQSNDPEEVSFYFQDEPIRRATRVRVSSSDAQSSMKLTEKDIVHEAGSFWVAHEGPGLFRVYQAGLTHSVRKATFHFSADPERARSRAIEDANRRAAEKGNP